MRRVDRIGLAITFAASPVLAVELQEPALIPSTPVRTAIDWDTVAQYYDVRGPTGESILPIRRLTSTLAAEASRVNEGGEVFAFRTRFRFDSDFGRGSDEINPRNLGAYVPGFLRPRADFLYAYFEARGLFRGRLDAKIGRQITMDPLGFWAFDGVSAKVRLPFPLELEAMAGFEERAGTLLSTGRYDRPGVWRGDRDGMDSAAYPSFLDASFAPAIGFTLASTSLSWLSAKLVYRNVQNTGDVSTATFDPLAPGAVSNFGWRVSSERLGFSATLSPWSLGALRTGFVFDFYNRAFTQGNVSIDAFLSKKWTVGADLEHFRPSFDADSIWNYFRIEPSEDMTVRASFQPSSTVSVSTSGGLRIRQAPDAQSLLAATWSARFRHRTAQNAHGAQFSGMWSDSARRFGFDVYAERTIWDNFVWEGRLSLWDFSDAFRPTRSATSIGTTVALGYRFAPRTKALIEHQLEHSRLVDFRNRITVWLSVGGLP